MNTTNNQKAIDLFNKLAGSYQERFFSVDHYKESLQILIDQLESNSTVLDIACGPGNISHYLLERLPGLKLLGIDMAPNMIDLARKNNPGASFLVYDALLIDQLKSNFDAVIIGFLFPYLSIDQVELFLFKVHEKLNDNGIIYLSTMEGLYENSRMKTSSTGEELMMHYYEADFLVRLMEQIGFHMISTRRQPFVISETESDTDLILIARKRSFFQNQ